MSPAPQLMRLTPCNILRPYIECYWILSSPSGYTPETQRMPADGRVEMMFSFGSDSERTTPDGGDLCTIRTSSFILGARGQGYVVDHFDAPYYVSVRFKPGGLSAFIDDPLKALSDIYVELDNLWERQAVTDLEDQLVSSSSIQAQAHLLDTALLAHFNPPDHLDRLLYAVEQISQPMTSTSMPSLADSVNLSLKHFERLFTRHIGFRPSLFARISRFQQAMYTALHTDKPLTLSQLALDTGYYDQAHFSKDFKRFTGLSPRHFFADYHEFVRLSSPAEDVDFLQD